MPDCLHCGGTGEEPFSDGEQCRICCGEATVPEQVNRIYHEEIRDALEEVPARRRKPVAWRWEAKTPLTAGWQTTHQGEPPEDIYGDTLGESVQVRDVTPLYERD